MGKYKPVMIGAALGAAGMYVGLQYHFLLAPEGMLMVPRAPQHSLGETYANVKTWDADTWMAHPRLSLAVTEYGRADLIGEGATSEFFDHLRGTLSPQQEQLGAARRGWEPVGPSGIPAPIPDGKVASASSSTTNPAPRRGFLSLADLFGLRNGAPNDNGGSGKNGAWQSDNRVMPTGRTSPPQVEFLPSPDDVQFGQPQRLPQRPAGKWRQSEAEAPEALRNASRQSDWEPITLLPQDSATI